MILKYLIRASLFLLVVIVLFIIITGGGFGNNRSPGPLENNKITFIAHRGLYNYYAENSYEGYEHCEEMGFASIETDIRVTKDKQLVVFHDDSTSRLLGKESLLDQINFSDLANYNLHFQGKATQNKVMRLDFFLENYKDKFIIYLDNKVNKRWVADSLIIHMKNNEAQNKVLVASSNLLFLSYIKYENKDIYTVLEGFDAGKEWIYHLIPKNFKPDYFSSFMSKVDDDQIAFMRNNRILDRKIVYGVDSSNVQAVLRSGIQHMIIDFDSSFTKVLHENMH